MDLIKFIISIISINFELLCIGLAILLGIGNYHNKTIDGNVFALLIIILFGGLITFFSNRKGTAIKEGKSKFFSSSSINYQQSVFQLLAALTKLQKFSQKLDLASSVELTQNALKRLERNSFSVAVVGDFKRGKTTFINALIGEQILPSDILPTTATVNRIAYRSTPSVKICFKNGSEQEIAIHQLSDYVTKLTSQSKAIAATIKEAIVYYPIPYLKNNRIEIIDTPGLSDDADMSAVTLSTLQECDCAIVVISARAPFADNEGKFLTQELLDNGISRILFVVNRIDEFDRPEEADKVIKYIESRIARCMQEWLEERADLSLHNAIKPQAWGVSALLALQAKQTKDMALLAKSRFVNFEDELKTIMEREQGIIVLEKASFSCLKAAREIIDKISSIELDLQLEGEQLERSNQIITETVSNLRERKVAYLRSVGDLFQCHKKQTNIFDEQLNTHLKQTAEQVIISNHLTNSEQKSLALKLNNAIQNETKEFAARIEKETQEVLSIAWVETKNYAELFNQVIPPIAQTMSQLGLDRRLSSSVMDAVLSISQMCNTLHEQTPISLSLEFPSNPETFVFEVNSGFVGTATGGALGFGLLGPLGAGIGVAIGAAIDASKKVNKLKESYPPLVIEKIEEQLQSMNVTQAIDSYISQSFSQLEELQGFLIKEVDSVLDATQTHLATIYGKRDATIAAKLREFNQMQVEVRAIMDYAQKLSEQLSKLTA